MEKRKLKGSEIENVSGGASPEAESLDKDEALSIALKKLNERPAISYAGPDQTYVLPEDLKEETK